MDKEERCGFVSNSPEMVSKRHQKTPKFSRAPIPMFGDSMLEATEIAGLQRGVWGGLHLRRNRDDGSPFVSSWESMATAGKHFPPLFSLVRVDLRLTEYSFGEPH